MKYERCSSPDGYDTQTEKLSQAELGKRSGINVDIVGKYERNKMKPSIETAKKLADALEVSLDYLVGEGELRVLDKRTLKRLEDIESLTKRIKIKYIISLIWRFGMLKPGRLTGVKIFKLHISKKPGTAGLLFSILILTFVISF